jgi:hypothetical protein
MLSKSWKASLDRSTTKHTGRQMTFKGNLNPHKETQEFWARTRIVSGVSSYIGWSFQFIFKVGVEESIVNAPLHHSSVYRLKTQTTQ